MVGGMTEFVWVQNSVKCGASFRSLPDHRRRSTESSHSYKYSPKHGSSDGSGRKKSSSVLQLVKQPREASSSTDALSSECESTPEEDDLQIQSLLMQSRNHLERTEALRVRSHLLRAEDYVSPFDTVVTRGLLSFVRAVLASDKWWPPQDGRQTMLPPMISRPILGMVVLLSVVSLCRSMWWE